MLYFTPSVMWPLCCYLWTCFKVSMIGHFYWQKYGEIFGYVFSYCKQFFEIFGEIFANFFVLQNWKKAHAPKRFLLLLDLYHDFKHTFDVNVYGFNHTFCVSVNENLKLIYTPCKCKTSYHIFVINLGYVIVKSCKWFTLIHCVNLSKCFWKGKTHAKNVHMGANEHSIPKFSNFCVVMGQSKWPIVTKKKKKKNFRI